MDISFRTSEGRFNYRVCAVIVDGGRILAMHDGRSAYYYLPGGRVEMSEAAEDAVLRELREELGIEARIERPLWLNQGFFTEDTCGERFHELCIYYLVDVSGTDLLARGERFERSEGRLHLSFEWLAFERLEKEYFYPTFLKRAIFALPEQLTIQTVRES